MNIDKDTLTVNELFSGIGAQRKALDRLGIAHEVVGICEIDKYAIQSYEAIFGKTYNYGDICIVPRLEYADLWTYSFPCQDISVAGNQKGISSETRSGLLYQVQRLLEVAKDERKLPKYLLLENVKNLVGKKFKSQFDDWLFYLDQLGYDTYWQVLNAKHYGIPQNRERVFAISIRKDLNQTFEFPKAEELKLRLKDILEDEVNEKFYLSQRYFERFIKSLDYNKYPMGNEYKVLGTTKAETERMGTNSRHWVYDTNSCMSTLDATMYKQPKQILVAIKEATKKGYAKATIGDSINIEQPNSKTRRGRVGHGVAQTLTTSPHQVVLEPKIQQVGNIVSTGNWDNPQCGRIYSPEGLCPTLNTMQGGNRQPKIVDNQIKKVDIPQIVKVRKYEVDNAKLVELLRSHKNLTNKQISDALKVPLTKVEHWFRTDNCFAIPDPEIWYKLKELLNIQTDEFDIAITTFEEKEGIYEKSNRCYLDSGIAPTLTTTSGDEKVIITDSNKFTKNKNVDLNVYREMVLENNCELPIAVDEQNVTVRKDYTVGTLTTDGSSPKKNNRIMETNFRIRKLTPLECWRLMGFDDEDFRKAESSGISNTQLYKQAGNSIVVNVLEKIFENMFLGKRIYETSKQLTFRYN